MSNLGGDCLFINNRLAIVLNPGRSFIRPGIETISPNIFCDTEVKTEGMVDCRASGTPIGDFVTKINIYQCDIDVTRNKVCIISDINASLLRVS